MTAEVHKPRILQEKSSFTWLVIHKKICIHCLKKTFQVKQNLLQLQMSCVSQPELRFVVVAAVVEVVAAWLAVPAIVASSQCTPARIKAHDVQENLIHPSKHSIAIQ